MGHIKAGSVVVFLSVLFIVSASLAASLTPDPVAEVYLATESENLTLLTKEPNTELVIRPQLLTSPTSHEFENVVLVCNAPYPIEWTYMGDGAPTRIYSSDIRTVTEFWNASSYEYFSTLVLMQERNNEHLTGTYTCRGLEYPYPQAYYHLYFPGGFGFPTIRNRVIRPPKNDSHVHLPCMSTDPTNKMMLFKMVPPKDESLNLTGHEGLTYDPKIGYIMDMRRFKDLFGTYYCYPEGFMSFWKMDLVPRQEDEVRFSPAGNVIRLENFSNQTFRCEAKKKVLFGFPTSFKFGVTVTGMNESNPDFPYSATFSLSPYTPLSLSSKYMRINCVTEEGRRLLKSWELTAIGTEEVRIKYDRDQRRILCCTKSGLSPTHQFVKCETEADCRIKSKCFQNGRCEYPFPPKFVDAPPGCSAVEFPDRVPTHVVRCSVGETSRVVPVIENIQGSDIILYDERIPETEQILKLSPTNSTKSGWVGFKCSGSLFFFSTNFVFGLEKADGSLVFLKNATVEDAESHAPMLLTEMAPDVRKVFCFAPLTRSAEWRNVSMPILVSKPSISNTTTAVRERSRLSTRRRSSSSRSA